MTLFSISINEILHSIPRGISRLLYVDDLVIYHAAANINHIERKLQIAINKIRGCCRKNGYRLSNDKTNAVRFRRLKGMQYVPNLQLNNENIFFKPVVKFLDLFLDQRLRFKDHIEYLRQKTIKRLNLLNFISNFNWRADRQTLLRIYRAVIRSKIDYGSQCTLQRQSIY